MIISGIARSHKTLIKNSLKGQLRNFDLATLWGCVLTPPVSYLYS